MGEGQRERERERIPSRLPIVSTEPDAGLKPKKSWDQDWATQAPQNLFLCNLYTQHGAQIHDPEIKSCMLYRLSQPGVPTSLDFLNVDYLNCRISLCILFYFQHFIYGGARVAQSVKRATLDFSSGHNLTVMRLSPISGPALVEACFRFSLSTPLLLVFSLKYF